MPVHVVVGVAAALGYLAGLGLQLLEADDVGAITVEPFAQLRFASANAVDVPGSDLHESRKAGGRFRASVNPSPIGSSERSIRSSR